MAELTTDQKLELALNDPHPVTVGGLNKVYRYIMSRISNSSSSGSAYYKIQGDVESFDDLLSLGTITETNDEPVTAGIIYNVKGADPTGATGVNYVCIRQYRIVNNNYQSKVYKTAREAGNIIYDPTKIYYLKVGENEWQVISNPDPELFNADTWYLFVFVDYQAGGVQVTTSNINEYYNHFWDSFGGSQPPASKTQLGVVKIGTNINVSNGIISVKTANSNTTGLVGQGDNTEINNSGVIRVPYANESGSNNTTKCGVLKVGDKINYDSSTHTINLSAGNAISIGTGDNAGQISVLYDGATIQKTTDNTNKLYARTAGPDTLGVVKVNANNDGTIKVVMTSGENSTSTGELVARTASTSTLGVVMNGSATSIGNGGTIDVNVDGTTIEVKDNNLHVLNANSTALGTVYQGDYVTIDSDGKISGNKAGSDFGVVKPIGSSNQLINDDSEVYGVDNDTIKIDSTNKYIYVDKDAVVKSGTNTTVSDGVVNVTSLTLGSTEEDSTYITVTNKNGGSSPAVKIVGTKNTDTTEPDSTNSALYVDGNIRSEGNISGSKVFHAVWNDISDAIEVQDDLEVEPGFCYMFDGKTYKKTEEYCQKGVLGIHSDTAGDILGRKCRHKELDIAIGGFVLAHVDDIYESGTPLTCGPDGCLTEMKREDVREYPERLVATYWRPEQADFWGPENSQIAVNGRQWVKVK